MPLFRVKLCNQHGKPEDAFLKDLVEAATEKDAAEIAFGAELDSEAKNAIHLRAIVMKHPKPDRVSSLFYAR